MDRKNFELSAGLVDPSYISQAQQSRNARSGLVRTLLANRKIPEEGWDEVTVNLFLQEISSMDSNNFLGQAGAGEREGRVFSSIVRNRHFGLTHGVGRSGYVTGIQPKAAGSSLIMQLANCLALDAVRIAGVSSAKSAAVLPVATGMSISLVLSAIRADRPKATRVLFLRIDQKSCLKSIVSAGFEVVMVSGLIDNDEVVTDLGAVEALLRQEAGSIACVLSTTSCFAPRVPDKLVDISKLCKEMNVPHVVNNAYGIQSKLCCGLLDAAAQKGRVDIAVQSTDKNFMVPVSGAVLISFGSDLMKRTSEAYPGRAGSMAVVDLTITLLSMGRGVWRTLLCEREALFVYLQDRLSETAAAVGERLLQTSENRISLGLTLKRLDEHGIDPNALGSMLFTRCVSGTRVVARTGLKREVCGVDFAGGFGAHSKAGYPVSYLTAAAAVGMGHDEADTVCRKIRECIEALLLQPATSAARAARRA